MYHSPAPLLPARSRLGKTSRGLTTPIHSPSLPKKLVYCKKKRWFTLNKLLLPKTKNNLEEIPSKDENYKGITG